MPNFPPTFRRSIGRYRRRAVAVFALGLIVAAGVAAQCPTTSDSEAPPAAPLAAAQAMPSPVVPPAEDNSSSHRSALANRQAELQSKLANCETRLKYIESERGVAEANIASLKTLLAAPAAPRAAPEVNAAPRLEDEPRQPEVRQQLDALVSREHELAAKMHDNHPQLQAVRQQIADLQAGLGELARDVAADVPREQTQSITPAPDPQPLARTMLTAERTRSEKLAIESRSLLAAREELHRQLREIHSTLAALVTEPDRPVENMPVPSASDPAVAATPLFSAATNLPSRRALVLAAGVLMAALLGLLTALVSAARNPILRTSHQLETLWDIPLAGTIPPDLRIIPAAG